MMAQFRAAYIVYDLNPCSDDAYKYFTDMIKEVTKEVQYISFLRIKIRIAIQLIQKGNLAQEQINTIFAEISRRGPTVMLPSASAVAMKESIREAATMVAEFVG